MFFGLHCLFSELIFITNKMMMTGGLSVVAPGSPVQLSLALLTMITLLLVTLKLGPFKNSMDDNVASLSSMSLSLTTFGGLALIMDKPEPENAFNPTMVGIGIIVVNCIMICVTVGNIFLIKCGLLRRAKKMVKTLSKKLTHVVPSGGEGPSHEEHEELKQEHTNLRDAHTNLRDEVEILEALLSLQEQTDAADTKNWGGSQSLSSSTPRTVVTSRQQLKDIKRKFGSSSVEYKRGLQDLAARRKKK